MNRRTAWTARRSSHRCQHDVRGIPGTEGSMFGCGVPNRTGDVVYGGCGVPNRTGDVAYRIEPGMRRTADVTYRGFEESPWAMNVIALAGSIHSGVRHSIHIDAMNNVWVTRCAGRCRDVTACVTRKILFPIISSSMISQRQCHPASNYRENENLPTGRFSTL
jgi:hypothetical protein